MKKVGRFLCLFLSLCLLVGVLGITAFAGEEKEDYDITVIGDSISSGYGLPMYQELAGHYWGIADGQEVPGSYAGYLRSGLQTFFDQSGMKKNVTLKADGRIAWRTTEFLNLMYKAGQTIPDYDTCASDPYGATTPEFFAPVFSGIELNSTDFFRYGITIAKMSPNTPIMVDVLDDSIVQDIEDAELVVVNFGANDIFTYGIAAILCKWVLPLADSVLQPGMNAAEALSALMMKFFEIYASAEEAQRNLILGDLLNAFEIGLDRFRHNIPLLLDAVQTINPDALVEVVGVVNPLIRPLQLGDASFDILNYFDPYVARANTAMVVACAARDNCEFVDVAGTSYWTAEYDFSLAFKEGESCFPGSADIAFHLCLELVKSLHPDEHGHKFMGQCLYNAVVPSLISPKILSADRGLLNKPLVKWEKVPGAYGYVVYRSLLPDGLYRPIKVVKGASTVDLSALKGLSYYYKVAAVLNGTGTLQTVKSDWVHAERSGSLLSLIRPVFRFTK